jgi:hypothetical protein
MNEGVYVVIRDFSYSASPSSSPHNAAATTTLYTSSRELQRPGARSGSGPSLSRSGTGNGVSDKGPKGPKPSSVSTLKCNSLLIQDR